MTEFCLETVSIWRGLKQECGVVTFSVSGPFDIKGICPQSHDYILPFTTETDHRFR